MAIAPVAARRTAQWQALGARLRSARQRAGWTQEQLAERLGLTQGHIAGVEAGHKRPSLETLEAWARALGEPLGELLREGGYVRGQSGLPPDGREDIDRRWDSLPAWLKRVAIRAVDAFLEERPRDGRAPEAGDRDER